MQISQLPIGQDGMETTKHGSYAFPLAVYHSVMRKNVLGHTPWHWHTEIQFCLVTAGSICFFVNQKRHLLHTGDGVFINSGYLHMAQPVSDPDSAYICLDMDPRLISSFPGSALEEKYVAPFLRDPSLEDCPLSPGVSWQKEILDRIRRAYRLFEAENFGYELRLTVLLQEMWLLLLENRTAAPAAPRSSLQENAAVQGILTYISQNYDQPVSLRALAKNVSFSDSECCRIFKKVTGTTIFSYLRSYRLARGMELLRDTQRSVSQIAYDTGFCSASYFIEAFRAQQGITPLQYRKKQARSL